jgi:hypothetical protein
MATRIVWIVREEQRPDFAAFLHRWLREQHERNLADADKPYLIALDEAQVAGILSEQHALPVTQPATQAPPASCPKAYPQRVKIGSRDVGGRHYRSLSKQPALGGDDRSRFCECLTAKRVELIKEAAKIDARRVQGAKQRLPHPLSR